MKNTCTNLGNSQTTYLFPVSDATVPQITQLPKAGSLKVVTTKVSYTFPIAIYATPATAGPSIQVITSTGTDNNGSPCIYCNVYSDPPTGDSVKLYAGTGKAVFANPPGFTGLISNLTVVLTYSNGTVIPGYESDFLEVNPNSDNPFVPPSTATYVSTESFELISSPSNVTIPPLIDPIVSASNLTSSNLNVDILITSDALTSPICKIYSLYNAAGYGGDILGIAVLDWMHPGSPTRAFRVSLPLTGSQYDNVNYVFAFYKSIQTGSRGTVCSPQKP